MKTNQRLARAAAGVLRSAAYGISGGGFVILVQLLPDPRMPYWPTVGLLISIPVLLSSGFMFDLLSHKPSGKGENFALIVFAVSSGGVVSAMAGVLNAFNAKYGQFLFYASLLGFALVAAMMVRAAPKKTD